MENPYIIPIIVVAAIIAVWALRLGGIMSTRDQQVSPVGFIDIAATVFVWFFLQMFGLAIVPFCVGITLAELQDIENLSAEKMLEFTGYLMLLQLLATAVAATFFLLRHRSVEWLGTRRSLAADIRIGILASLLLLPIVMMIQSVVTTLIPYEHPTIDSLMENFSGKTAIWAWIAAVGVAPLTEEFFFRGVIQGCLQRVFDHSESRETWLVGGPVVAGTARELSGETPLQRWTRFWAPILITSVAFAGVHFGQGPAPIPLFFLSIGIGYIFRKTGSFVPCVVIHLLLNSISMGMLTIGMLYPDLMPTEPEPAAAFSSFWSWLQLC